VTESERIFHDGLTTLRAWQGDKTPLTFFTLGFPGALTGRLSTTILQVGPTGRVVIELPGSLLQSTAIDLTQAEFEMIEADMVPSDSWFVSMGIEQHKRFLSVKCPNGANAVFGERERSIYQRITDCAAEQGIRLDTGYVVWVVNDDLVLPSVPPPPLDTLPVELPRNNPLTIFAREGAARAFAEKHDRGVRVFVTGPVNEQCDEITTRT